MKKIILTAGILLGAMLFTDVDAQDRNVDARDEETEVNPEGEAEPNPAGSLDDQEEKDDREILQDNAEEENSRRPSSSIDSTERKPQAIPANPAEMNKGDEPDEIRSESRDTIKTEDNATEAERGIGTNSSDSNVNYRTGMPSNTTTPKQLKD